MPRNHTKAGQTAHLEGNKTFAINASDTVNVTQVGANFHVNITGNYNVLLSGDDSPVQLFLVAGMVYPYRIKRLYLTDTDNPTGLVGIDSVNTEIDKE